MATLWIHRPHTVDTMTMGSSVELPHGRPAPRAWPAVRHDDGLVAVLHRADAASSGAASSGWAPSGEPTVSAQLASGAFEVVDIAITRATIDRLVRLRPDVVVVVLDPPGFDVVRLCRDLRASVDSRIVVVARQPLDEASTVAALDAGADDVVPAEMSGAVLDARVRVALRAQPMRTNAPARLEVGDVLVDMRAHSVHVAGALVRCPPVQYALLAALAETPNAAIGRDQLLRVVWGVRPGEVHPRRLRIAISVLRAILGTGPRRPVIETIPRLGYRLFVPTDVGR
jgi:DNA-binding response OmpR family regulator